MKKVAILLACILMFLVKIPVALAQNNLEDLMESQLNMLDFSQIESYLKQVDQDVSQYLPDLNLQNFWENMRNGKVNISFEGLVNGLAKFFFYEIIANFKLLSVLIVLAVLSAVLESIHSSFEGNNLRKITFWVCSLALYTIALGSFTLTLSTARATIDKMVTFFNSLIPILVTLIVGVGHVTSAAILSPVILTTTGFFLNIINQVVMPLIYAGTVLMLLDHVSQNFKIDHLAKLCRDTALSLIGLSLTIYTAVLNIQGVAGNVSDGVALETAKFATGSFVPIVGKLLSDAMEAVVGTSLLLKSAVSVLGMLLIGLICVFPLLKILSVVVIYRVVAALVQPFGAKPIADSLNTIGNCLLLVFAAVTAVAVMLFIGISILVKVGKPI